MPGIIQTQINKADPFSDIKGYEAEKVEADPASSVESRVQGIIDRGGPAAQSEVTRATQAANRKGLVNTSMAVGDAERARIDRALPIAQQDSSQSLQRRMADQAALNRGLEFTSGQTNIAGQQERAGQQQQANIATQAAADKEKLAEEARLTTERDIALAKEQRGVASTLAETDAAAEEARFADLRRADIRKAQNDLIMANVDADNQVALTKIQGEYQERIQVSTNAANIYAAHSSNITDILSNPKIKAANKQGLIAQETKLLENALAVQDSISNIDLSGILDFSSNQPNQGQQQGSNSIRGFY